MGVSIREKNKDGIWWTFIRHAGQRVSFISGTKDDAEKDAQDARDDIRRGRFSIEAMKAARAPEVKKASAVPTLADFVDKTMLPLWEASLARKTYERYEGAFRIHIAPAIGSKPLNELTRDRIKDFLVELMKKNVAAPNVEQDTAAPIERKLSKDSIRNVHATLRGALSEAVERGLIAANPAVRLGKVYREAGQVREEVDPFTAAEIPLLLNAALTHFGHDNYVMLLAFFHTGLRAAELAGLEWPDVDFKNRFLMVRRQFSDGAHKKTKTKKMRKVDISDALLQELKTLKKRRQAEYLARGKNEIPSAVFLGPGQIVWDDSKPKRAIGHTEGKPWNMDNWRNRIFWKACDKAQIRRRRLHDTRHTFASILLMNGESPAYVKEQLGHSSIKMTVDVYGHFIPGANRQAVNRLPSLATVAAQAQASTGD